MADTHEGFSLGIHVDSSELKATDKLLGAIYQRVERLDQKFGNLHIGRNVPGQMQKISSATSETTRRIQETGKAYQSNSEHAKNFGSAAEGACKQASESAKGASASIKSTGKAIDESISKKRETTIKVNNAEAKRKTGEVKHVIDKIPRDKSTSINARDHASGVLDKIKGHLNQADKAARNTSHTIRNFAIGGAIANGLSSIASSAYSAGKGILKEGIALNETTEKINTSFHNMGMGRRQIKGLDNQIGYLKRTVGLTGVQTANMQRQMMTWSKTGVGGAKSMTTAIAAIGASTRMPADQIAKMGGQLMRVGASGKVTASSLTRITRNAGGFYRVLAKGAGMSESQMKATLATGKVTQAQFQAWMLKSAKYAPAILKQYGNTVEGTQNKINAGWQQMEQNMTKPLMNVRKSGMAELATLMNSKAVQNGATMLGEAVRQVAIWAMKGLKFISNHRKDVVSIGSAFVQIAGTLAKDVWKDFTGIVFQLAKDFGLVKKNAKPGSSLHQFAQAMTGLAKNKGAIHAIARSLEVIAGLTALTKVASAVEKIGSVLTPSDAMKANASKLLSAGKSYWAAGKAEKAAGGGAITAFGAGATVLAAGTQAASAIQNRHSATKRSRDIGGSIGSALGGSIATAINPALAPVGIAIGTAAGRLGGNAVNHFTQGWQRHKPPKNKFSLQNFGWNTHKWVNEAGRTGSKMGKAVGKWFKGLPRQAKKTSGSINSWARKTDSQMAKSWRSRRKSHDNSLKQMQTTWHQYTKVYGQNWGAFCKATSKWAKQTWNDTKRNWGSFQKSFGTGWHSFQKSFGAGWRTFWHGVGTAFSNVWKGIKTIYDDTIGGIAHGMSAVAKFFGSVGKFGGKVRSAVSSAAGKAFKGHAAGGRITRTAGALVGEQGPELAYKPGQARLLGANGPQVTRVHAGEHILNARDTAKVMSGGLGAGIKLRGFASGTDQVKKTGTSVKRSYQKMTKDTKSELGKIATNNKKSWTRVKTDATKQVKSLGTKNNSQWRTITSQTKRQTTNTRRNAVSQYTKMKSGVTKQMTGLKNQTISLAKTTARGFGKNLDRMKGYSKDAMQDTIDQVNRGIRGIDKVLGQFGGNTSVIKPVHFATGTGALNHNTLAMVNDAKTGPWQEAIYKGNGDLIIPAHKNRVLPLEKGDAVLNGYQTQTLAHQMGMEHFAKGSGVSHSALRKIAERGGNNPAKSFAEMYSRSLKQAPPDIEKGTTGLAQHSSTTEGVPWMQAMWAVINQAIGEGTGKGGTREAFLHYAEKTFSGVKYVMGAASHAASDCSGMVMQALRHFGLDIGRTTVAMQHSAGVQYLGKDISKTIPGDLVIYGHGTGAAGHVGIIKNPRTHSMFNETPPYARVTSVDGPKAMGYGFYRVRGLHNAHQKKQAENKPLMALAKRELGAAAIKWIKKNLGDTLGSLGAFSMSGDIGSRARALAGGLQKLDPRATKNGIAAILGNWEFESTLNPGAVNPGGGAFGLGQWLGGRLSNLKAYARRHGMSWKNPGAQLSFAVKGEGSDSAIFRRILEGHGSVSSLANAFSSEWERGGYNAQHVAGARMIRHALGYAGGGEPQVGSTVMVGEHGPELAQFKQPVHVYDNKKTKKMDFASLLGRPQQAKPAKSAKPVTININLNGPISSTHEAQRVGDVVKRQVAEIMERYFGDEMGTDPSVY